MKIRLFSPFSWLKNENHSMTRVICLSTQQTRKPKSSGEKKRKMAFSLYNFSWWFSWSTFFSHLSSICHSPEEIDIQNICSKSCNPFKCMNQFKSGPRSHNTDIKGLTRVAINLALNEVNTVHTLYNLVSLFGVVTFTLSFLCSNARKYVKHQNVIWSLEGSYDRFIRPSLLSQMPPILIFE